MKHTCIFAPVDYNDVTETYDDEHKFMAFDGGWKEVSVWVDEFECVTTPKRMLIHLQRGTGSYFNERIKKIIEKRMQSLDCRCMQ